MHESAENLRNNVASAFGMADHLRDAFHEWIDSVEERLGKKTKAKEPETIEPAKETKEQVVSGTFEVTKPKSKGD